ncbi:WD40 repeat domain-containing protein, partial [Nostoc sp. XA013]|nr:WD40 repeat domain-containing protein [Nostoc sp. XA013]
ALSFKNSIAIIDTGQSAVIGIINTPDPILMSEFAPDSASLVTVSVRGHFQKWNLLSLPRFNLSKLKIDAAMSPDSKLVAYINPTMIDVIDLSDNKIILREGLLESRLAKVGDTLDFNPDSNLYRIAFSKTADTLLYSFGDGSVADFDIASKKHKLLIPASEGAIEARVDASGSGYVLTTGSELFLNHADKPINLTDIGPKEISVSAGGDYVIASHEAVDSEETFEIRLWDTKTQRLIWTALSHGFDERCPGPRFSPTAKYIICYNDSDQGYPGVSPEEEVSHIREATAGAIVNPAPSDFAGRITTAKFSDDERLVVVWSLEEQTLLWGPPDFVLKGKQASKYQIKSLPGAYGGFLRISPNNQILAMSRGAGGKQEILLLSLNTTAEPIVLRHSLVIEDAAFSQDSKYVATLEQNGDAYVWDSGTGQQVSWLTLGRDANRIAFNLGGDKLIIQGEDLDGVFVESLEWQAAALQSAVCARIRNVYSLADIRAMTAGDGVGACIP